MRAIIWERIKQSKEGEAILYLGDFSEYPDFPYFYQVRHCGKEGSHYKVFFNDHYKPVLALEGVAKTVPEAKLICQEFHENVVAKM